MTTRLPFKLVVDNILRIQELQCQAVGRYPRAMLRLNI